MDKTQNFVVGLVKTAPSPATSGTSLVIDQSYADYFPDPSTFGAYNLVIWNRTGLRIPANCEVVRVTAKTDTSDGAWTTGEDAKLTITRAQESSTALSVEADFLIYMSGTGKLFDDIETALTGKEVTSNKVTSISGSSTDTQYPSAKLVYDQLALKETKKSVGSATTAPDVSGTYTLTVDVDTYKEYLLTAQANPFTVAAPTGTPVAGQKLILRFKDNGTARAITWNAAFRAGDLALPTTTVISKTMYIGFEWNATDSKWDLIALATGF